MHLSSLSPLLSFLPLSSCDRIPTEFFLNKNSPNKLATLSLSRLFHRLMSSSSSSRKRTSAPSSTAATSTANDSKPKKKPSASSDTSSSAGPTIFSGLRVQAAPALSSGLTVTTWVVWGIGSALLLMLGAGLHLFVAMWRRRGGGPGAQPGRVLSAG